MIINKHGLLEEGGIRYCYLCHSICFNDYKMCDLFPEIQQFGFFLRFVGRGKAWNVVYIKIFILYETGGDLWRIDGGFEGNKAAGCFLRLVLHFSRWRPASTNDKRSRHEYSTEGFRIY